MKTKIITLVMIAITFGMVSCNQNQESQGQSSQEKQDAHEHSEARDAAVKKLSISVDKINSLTDEITEALKESHFHDIAEHSEGIRNEIDVMLNNITDLSNSDFTKLKDLLNQLRKSTDDLKHDAENKDHNNIHHTFDQFVKDFADLRVDMPKI
jgi:hypothetical protein